ncbi:hypothetical protein EVAR_84925_1 [Eumeta japonica]|uniref:Uncharacterized protein n=1 Tax=Eumeta variegata TaxID=151549 RepID=A0A4C1VH91_EUMVA|nr:hypothetical protein EVAR_84925_1 [Eumeta japonica]
MVTNSKLSRSILFIFELVQGGLTIADATEPIRIRVDWLIKQLTCRLCAAAVSLVLGRIGRRSGREIACSALSLARSAQAERDNESCFFKKRGSQTGVELGLETSEPQLTLKEKLQLEIDKSTKSPEAEVQLQNESGLANSIRREMSLFENGGVRGYHLETAY